MNVGGVVWTVGGEVEERGEEEGGGRGEHLHVVEGRHR